MYRIYLKYSLAIIVVIVMGVSIYKFYFSAKLDATDVELEQVVESEAAMKMVPQQEIPKTNEAESEDISTKVSELHKEMNGLVGWLRYRNVRWEDQRKLNGLLSQVDFIKANTKSSELQQDMENMRACIEVAIANEDSEGLIYAHRIIHDLDHFMNNHLADNKVYNVTAYGNDKNIKVVIKYIN
jgi:aspartate oxidase